jgi:phospholipid/cholesterol/gamma-HCH transport system substrate-binding protein
MPSNIVETVVGGIVVCVAVIFLGIGYVTTSKVGSAGSVHYNAEFDSIDGIVENGDVKIGGVCVGKVSSIQLSDSYKVVVTIVVRKQIQIPDDSVVTICSSGFMGDKYIAISTGQSTTYLNEGDTFVYAREGLSMEQILNKVIAALVNKK